MDKTKPFLCILFSFAFSFTFFAKDIWTIPLDTTVRCGKLANGLTYYIRHNEQPKQRAEFYIAQNVGAILEEDHQCGLAHFLEHMAFNGTTHFPGNKLIDYLETIGVRFGENINAFTSLDETVYNLSDVPTNREGIVDSALLILHDWSNSILLDDKEIDKERGVIREEWRQRQDARHRLLIAINRVTMAGSQYAKRDIIGDTTVINRFSYQTLKDFYRKWYRPDLQAVLIVGDINVAQVEAKIKSIFSDIPAPKNAAERIYYSIPDNEEPIVGVFTDPEMETTQMDLYFKHEPIPDSVRSTSKGYTAYILQHLVSSMTSNRLDEIRQEPETPFAETASFITDLTRTKDVYVFSCTAVSGKEKQARERLLKEAESIRRFGFTQTELDRAKSNMLCSYEKSYNERYQQKNQSLVLEYIRNFLAKEPIPGIQWEYRFLKEQLPSISLDSVNLFAQNYMGKKNVVYTITCPEKEGTIYPSDNELQQEIVLSGKLELQAYRDSVSTEPLVTGTPKPGKIKKCHKNKTLGSTEWILSNGVKVLFKPTPYKEDEIQMAAWSNGGFSLLPDQDLASAMYTVPVVNQSGLGTLSLTELNKKLAGKIVTLNPYIASYEEGFKGGSSVKDLETLLQLVYLYFTSLRNDENAYQYVMNTVKTYLENAALDPNNAYSDSITSILYNHHPRVLTANMENLEKVNQTTIQRIFKERFGNPADFTFEFVGKIDEKMFQPLVERYLGSLKTSKKKESWKDNGIRIQKGQLRHEIKKPLKVNRASNYVRYSFEIPYSMENLVTMSAVEKLLELRYTATIREKEGASYGVDVSGFVSKKPVEAGNLIIRFDTDPKLNTKMLGIIHSEIQALSEKGPEDNDLNKVKQSMIKQFHENTVENQWWIQTLSTYSHEGLDFYSDYTKIIENLNAKIIKDLVKKMLQQNNHMEILLTPEQK